MATPDSGKDTLYRSEGPVMGFVFDERVAAVFTDMINRSVPHFEDAALNALFIDLHHRFKEQNGYTQTEISRKRAAIENVPVPETLRAHDARIREAGFGSFAGWFQCFNFASMVAVKGA